MGVQVGCGGDSDGDGLDPIVSGCLETDESQKSIPDQASRIDILAQFGVVMVHNSAALFWSTVGSDRIFVWIGKHEVLPHTHTHTHTKRIGIARGENPQ